jgi:hypothetical protein
MSDGLPAILEQTRVDEAYEEQIEQIESDHQEQGFPEPALSVCVACHHDRNNDHGHDDRQQQKLCHVVHFTMWPGPVTRKSRGSHATRFPSR